MNVILPSFVETVLERCWFNCMTILEFAVCGAADYTDKCLYYFTYTSVYITKSSFLQNRSNK